MKRYLIILSFLPLFLGAQNSNTGLLKFGNGVARFGDGLVSYTEIENLFDFWTITTASPFTYSMTLNGTSGKKIYIDWGDDSTNTYTFTGSNQTITHNYETGVFKQKWAVNKLDVTNISASTQRISGVIPDALQGFYNITLLLLSNNSLHGDIGSTVWVTELNKWVNLDQIFLDRNDFSCDLSSWSGLTSLTSLRAIYLWSNNFTGDLSSWSSLTMLTSMINFRIYDNNFTGDLSSWDFSSWNLFYFLISSNNFTGNVVDFGQSSWPSLIQYFIHTNSLTGLNDNINVFFVNRTTYTAATKTIQVQNNSELLTGIYQEPDLGTYPGLVHDLTEAEITNLAAGTDYDGLGTNIAWSTLEKIWILENLDTTSTSGVKRYNFNVTY